MNALQIATFPIESRPRDDSGHRAHVVRRRGAPRARQQFGEFGKFKTPKFVKNIGRAVVKGAKDTGHAAGAVVTSTAGKAILGTALALTGAGIPASALIMSSTQAGGQLIRKGGNLRKTARGAAEGAVEGAAAGVVGKVLGKSSTIQTLRQKLGTAPKPTATPVAAPAVQPSYDSNPNLDALAAGKIPDVSTITTAPQTLFKPMTEVAPVVTAVAATPLLAVAKRKRQGAVQDQKDAASAGAKGDKKGMQQKLRDAAKKLAEAAGIQNATGVSAPPSSDPTVPQGGFNPTPFPTMSTDNTDSEAQGAGVNQASVAGGGISEFLGSPVGLVVAAGVLFLLTNKRR